MSDDVTLLASSLGGSVGVIHRASTHVLVVSKADLCEQRIPVGQQPVRIGRTAPCEIVLGDSSVSRQHCRVELIGDQVCLTDLGSTNGTFVNGRRATTPVTLDHGAIVQIGAYILNYERRTAKEVDEALAAERDAQGANAYVNMLLPKPILSGPVHANWLYRPCDSLSGNAFGYRFLSPSIFAGFMLDVAGHGMEAAMHSVAVMNFLRQTAIPGVDLADPASVLASLNKTFNPEHHRGMFFSIWYFSLDLKSRRLRFGSAGRHFGFLQSEMHQRPDILNADDPAIGLEPGHEFATFSLVALPRSTLYLLSDSACEWIEQNDEPDQNWFARLIETGRSANTPEPLRLYSAVKQKAGPVGIDGDFSTIVLDF